MKSSGRKRKIDTNCWPAIDVPQLEREKSPRAEAVRKDITDNTFFILRHPFARRNEQEQSQLACAGDCGSFGPRSWQHSHVAGSGSGGSLEKFRRAGQKRLDTEAQSEMQNFPKPQNVKTQILFGEKLAAAGLSQPAIHWLNEAMDQDNSLRKKKF